MSVSRGSADSIQPTQSSQVTLLPPAESSCARRAAEIDRLQMEMAMLSEELALKDARWARLHARPPHGLSRPVLLLGGRGAGHTVCADRQNPRTGPIIALGWATPAIHAEEALGCSWGAARDVRGSSGGRLTHSSPPGKDTNETPSGTKGPGSSSSRRASRRASAPATARAPS